MLNQVIFNNKKLNDYMVIKEVKNSLLPSLSSRSIKISGQNGEYFVRREMGIREITVEAEIIADNDRELERKLRRAVEVLSTNEPKFLITDGQKYKAILDGSTILGNIKADRTITMNFIAHDPLSYGNHREVKAENGQKLFNGGTYEARGEISFVAQNELVTIQLRAGNPQDFIRISGLTVGQNVKIDMINENTFLGGDLIYVDPIGDYFAFPSGEFQLDIYGTNEINVSFYERWL